VDLRMRVGVWGVRSYWRDRGAISKKATGLSKVNMVHWWDVNPRGRGQEIRRL